MPQSNYDEQDRDIAYRGVCLIVEHLVQCVRNIIVDATYARSPHLEELHAVAKAGGSGLCLIQCTIPPDLAADRFRERGRLHPAVDLHEERVLQLTERHACRPDGLILDTSGTVESCMEEVRRYLGLNFGTEG